MVEAPVGGPGRTGDRATARRVAHDGGRLLAMVLVSTLLLAHPVWGGSASGSGTVPEPGSCAVKNGVLSVPYGTKSGLGWFTPTFDDTVLIFVDVVYPEGATYTLTFDGEARDLGSTVLPDFDVYFDRDPFRDTLHNARGDDAGTIPSGTVGIYVYMPTGPDGGSSDDSGTGASFTFTQCPVQGH